MSKNDVYLHETYRGDFYINGQFTQKINSVIFNSSSWRSNPFVALSAENKKEDIF